jgi:hypothetical protein
MDANQPLFVVCRNGVFLLPQHVYATLASQVTNGWVYVRQDEESLTISTTRITGGFRRLLHIRMRAPMFRGATKLGIVDYKESIRVISVR